MLCPLSLGLYHFAQPSAENEEGAMPTLNIPDGEIYYEVHGSGFPLMIFAPGGLRSKLAFWRHSPSNPSAPAVWMDPMAELGKKYRSSRSISATPAARVPGSAPETTGIPTRAITWLWRTTSGSTGSTPWAAASAPRSA